MNAALLYHLLRCHLESLFVRMHQSSFLGDWDFCCVLWTDEGWRNGRLAFNTLIIQSVSDMNWWINSGILTDLFVSGHEWIILSKTVRSVPVLPRSVPGNQPTSIQLPALVNNDLFTMTSAVQCEIAILLWNHIDELFFPFQFAVLMTFFWNCARHNGRCEAEVFFVCVYSFVLSGNLLK